MVRDSPVVKGPREQGNGVVQSPALDTKVSPVGVGSATSTDAALPTPL